MIASSLFVHSRSFSSDALDAESCKSSRAGDPTGQLKRVMPGQGQRLTHLPVAPVGEWKTSKRPTKDVRGMELWKVSHCFVRVVKSVSPPLDVRIYGGQARKTSAVRSRGFEGGIYSPPSFHLAYSVASST